jgi:uncharacterized membrane protein YeaQ/YmgE (transglycosylase-associated protein family)
MIWNLIGWLIIGGLAGWIASLIMKTNKQQGLMMDIGVGIVGSFIGGIIFTVLPITIGGLLGSLIVAVVGAVVLLAGLKFVQRRT